MIFLADFSVIKPDFGLFFWTVVIFALFWILIGKFAFKPIAKALQEREDDIQTALDEAVKTREEMSSLKAQNEALLAEAREERSKMLKEAKETKDAIIKEARESARQEADKIMTQAMTEIENQRKQVVEEVKNQAGLLAIDIAERLLRAELQDRAGQERLVQTLIKEVKLS